MKKIFAVLAVTAFLAGCAADDLTHISCINNADVKACSSLCGGEDKSHIKKEDKKMCKGKTYKKGMTNGCYCRF